LKVNTKSRSALEPLSMLEVVTNTSIIIIIIIIKKKAGKSI